MFRKDYPEISFDNKTSISAAIQEKQSFRLSAIKRREAIAVRWVRQEIEKQGMTCLTYTNNRWLLAAPVALIPYVGPWLAGAAAAKFAAENIRSPDYEIRHGFLFDLVEVTYRKSD